MLERRFHPGFHLTGPAAPEGHHPNLSGPLSYADIVFDARLKHGAAYCGKNKAKVYYEAQRSAPPAFASLGSFTLKFSELDTFSYKKRLKETHYALEAGHAGPARRADP